MTALAAKRVVRPVKFSSKLLKGKTEQVYRGGIACFDTSTGLVAKAFVSTTLMPIGRYAEDQNTASGGSVLVELFKEVVAHWYANDGTVVAGTVGSLCYLVDDQTVANADATNTRSVAGRVWEIDSVKGVLVEFVQDPGSNTGLDV